MHRAPFVFALLAFLPSLAWASPSPTSLSECYLRLAATKADADLAYLVREMCNDIFAPKRRSLFVLESKNQACEEWWLDPHGRYETAEMLCRLEPGKDASHWSLACQNKNKADRVSLVQLRTTSDGAFERVGEPVGDAPGAIFSTLRSCIQHKKSR